MLSNPEPNCNRKRVSTATFRSSVEVACADGVEDVSDDDSDTEDEKRRLERKLNKMGYDDSDSDESESEEESTGELLVKMFYRINRILTLSITDTDDTSSKPRRKQKKKDKKNKKRSRSKDKDMKSPDNRKKSKSPLPNKNKNKKNSPKKRGDESVEFSVNFSQMSLDDQTVGTTKSELRRQRDYYGQAYEEKKAELDAAADYFKDYNNQVKQEVKHHRDRADMFEKAYQAEFERAEREQAERERAERERNRTRGRDASRSRSRDRVPDEDDSHVGSVDGTDLYGGLNGLD